MLDPGEFYILASKEAVRVPADHAAEMLAYDTAMGEFRVHYAGFFDPGFGHADAGGEGTRAVLEVRSHEVPFMLEDGQRVGHLVYERLVARPDACTARTSARHTSARVSRCPSTSGSTSSRVPRRRRTRAVA